MTSNVFPILCSSIALASIACAPYIPPVPANPLGDANAIRVNITPVNESNPNGPLRMALRKRLDRGWINLGDLCEAASDGTAPNCPAHRVAHVTYVTPGTYKMRAEYVGPTGKTLWGSVVEEIHSGYVYACEVSDADLEGCQKTPIGEATEAVAAPPVLSSPGPTGPGPSSTPTPLPGPSPSPTSGGCQKDVDCAGDLICRAGTCVSAGQPPPVEIVSAPPVEIAPAPAPVVITPAKSSACDTCPGKCASHKQACNAGTISSCYELGACLCECKLDAGGCGDAMAALTECIATNRAKAKPKPPVE